MKILIFGDVHWSTTTSLINARGKHYTKRLDLLIDSVNWVEELSNKHECEFEVCLGDFFDKSTITDEEISALKEIVWNDKLKYFLVGNHESSRADLQTSSTNALSRENIVIIDKPFKYEDKNISYYFLPYELEHKIGDLKAELDRLKYTKTNANIVFSHNDIAGIQYGAFLSKSGFNVDEINSTCDLFINGHLHNQYKISPKILNAGSLSAHNFTNDSLNYEYGAWILDTDSLQLQFYENPYSLHFYKFEIDSENDISALQRIKPNSAISVKCSKSLIDTVKQNISDNAIAYRVIANVETLTGEDEKIKIDTLRINHLDKLVEFCMAKLPNTEILTAELAEICK